MAQLPLFIADPQARYAEVTRRVELGLKTALFDVDANLVEGVRLALEQANNRTSLKLIDFAEQLGEFGTAAQRLEAHTTLGRNMHDSVLRSYRQARRKFNPARYQSRPNRMQHGALERALANPDNIYRASPNGILFINDSGLYQAARQWARLNFGAGARGQGALAPFTVRFSNLVVATLGLEEGPRPAFGMPYGYFLSNEGEPQFFDAGRRGEDAFYVRGTGPRSGLRAKTKTTKDGPTGGFISSRGRMRPTKGITGYNFLDAGVARLARDFGPTYERLYKDVTDAASRRPGPSFRTSAVRR